MKKNKFIILSVILLMGTSCDKDYLNVVSPSSVDQDFVFSSPSEAYKVIIGCYELWRENVIIGLYYDLDAVGSDSECHPEAYAAQLRHVPEGLYASEITINYTNSTASWARYYQIANRASIIMEAIGEVPEYQSAVNSGQPNEWTQIYGEAAVLRAYCYHLLVVYFGDVPLFKEPIYLSEQADGATLASRDDVWDFQISELRRVEPLMYRLGEGGINAERFSRTFAQAMIGKMALYAGGYGLRRTNFDYGNVQFEQLGTEKWDAKYVRRTDYKNYYEIAKTYFKACLENSGSAYLITSDSRGSDYDNPFQLNFQYNMDLVVSPESLYEVGENFGTYTSRPYAFGRPSIGASSNAYPPRGYGQSRMYASFYYGECDPKDLRRDVTTTVTINSGACSEVMLSFIPGSRDRGGLVNNKWDESRQPNVWTLGQRKSGINWTMLRMADVHLMLAEVYAELGEEGSAKTELTKVRKRAFLQKDQTEMVTNYIGALSGDKLKEAIQQERKLELTGEGFRRYDLIRTGKMPEKIIKVRNEMKAMVAGLKTNGYYTFENGNTISKYIYVKKVNVADFGMTKMLTKRCNVDENDPAYPVKFPGWRGNADLWYSLGYTPTDGKRNLAIQGLFKYIDPNGAEAAALVADGYVKTNWGIDIVNNESQYTIDIFKGYPDAYFAAGVPPRYMVPLPEETISKSNGLITNGYGFTQE